MLPIMLVLNEQNQLLVFKVFLDLGIVAKGLYCKMIPSEALLYKNHFCDTMSVCCACSLISFCHLIDELTGSVGAPETGLSHANNFHLWPNCIEVTVLKPDFAFFHFLLTSRRCVKAKHCSIVIFLHTHESG